MAQSDIKNEINKYVGIFAVLVVLTGMAVGVSLLKLGWAVSIPLILLISCVMGFLVSWRLMHLSSEKKTILIVLCLAAVFFLVMVLLIYAAHFSVPEGLKFVS